MTPPEHSEPLSITEASSESTAIVTGSSSLIRKGFRTLFTATAIGLTAVGGYVGYQQFRELEQREYIDGTPFFAAIPDGDIVGKTLIYVDDETGERVRATFHMDADTLSVEVNGEMFQSRQSVRAFIVGIRKVGRTIVADLAIPESTIEIPAQSICAIGKAANASATQEIVVSSDFHITGPASLIPNLKKRGTHHAPLVRVIPIGRIIQ